MTSEKSFSFFTAATVSRTIGPRLQNQIISSRTFLRIIVCSVSRGIHETLNLLCDTIHLSLEVSIAEFTEVCYYQSLNGWFTLEVLQ